MSHQSPFEDRAGLPSLRRKRPIFVLAASLVALFLIFRAFPFPFKPATHLDDLYGMLYMVSMTENLLPQGLDVKAPVSPSVWVPRETFNQELWKKRIDQLDEDTPLVVFSKTYCPYSRRAKDLLARYALEPVPHVVEVDLRDDSATIKGLLYRLTGRATFPNVILRGKSLGGYDDIRKLHDSGELESELTKAGVKITGDIHGE